jgi:hypothetical protein
MALVIALVALSFGWWRAIQDGLPRSSAYAWPAAAGMIVSAGAAWTVLVVSGKDTHAVIIGGTAIGAVSIAGLLAVKLLTL